MRKEKKALRARYAKALKKGLVPANLEIPGLKGELFPYQKTAVLWLLLTPKALLADDPGLGKTCMSISYLQMLKIKGKLSNQKRAIIIVPAPSIYGTWKVDGFEKFLPSMKVAIGRGTKAERLAIYNDPTWEVLLTNYEMVRVDTKEITKLNFKTVLLDEAEVISNLETLAAKAVAKITRKSPRVVAMTATPVKNGLLHLHGILILLGLEKVFGNVKQFKEKHLNYILVRAFYNGKWGKTKKFSGYKNTKEFKSQLNPYYLRRAYKDVDVPIPSMRSHIKWLELTSNQKKSYNALKKQIAESLHDDSTEFEVRAGVLKLRQLIVTSAHYDPNTNHSSKFDWLVKQLKGSWSEEQAIVFLKYKDSIKALQKRLDEEGIRHITITGDVNQKTREELRQQFWADPKLQVLIGTTAIERSLNLQCARIQVNLDMIKNPSRHTQFAGRVRRVGSRHERVYIFFALIAGTVEEEAYKAAQENQAVADHIFDEEADLFDKLSKKDLLKLIRS